MSIGMCGQAGAIDCRRQNYQVGKAGLRSVAKRVGLQKRKERDGTRRRELGATGNYRWENGRRRIGCENKIGSECFVELRESNSQSADVGQLLIGSASHDRVAGCCLFYIDNRVDGTERSVSAGSGAAGRPGGGGKALRAVE